MLPRTGIIAALALSIGAALVGPVAARAADHMPESTATESPAFLETTDQIIVTTTSGRVTDRQITTGAEAAAADVGLDVAAESGADISRTTSVVRLDANLPIDQVAQIADQMADEPGIVSARPDRRVAAFADPPPMPASVTLPDDTFVGQQWDLWDGPTSGTGGYSVRGPAAWPVTTGTGAVVAVLDTGITSHPDLDANVVPGYDFINNSLVANDGNGWDADPSDPGDWITSAEASAGFFRFCSVGNSSWHGTHVAGTIAGISGAGHGISGIAPTAKIQPVRVLGKCGGYTSDIMAAVTWASGGSVYGVPSNPTPADVINLSLGGSGGCSAADDAVFAAARDRGTVVVVAAGNSNADASGFWPANCSSVVAVSSTGKQANRAYYSNYGAVVDIDAPGGDYSADSGYIIYSTFNTGTQSPVAPTWHYYQGTSMAAPHVAGVAALVAAADPTLTAAQIATVLTSTAQPFPVGSTCTTSICGAGIVDAGAAIAALAPSGPQSLAVSPGVESLSVAWSPPSRGAAISTYGVQYSSDDSTWIPAGAVNATSATITGLTAGLNYRVRVNATNPSGTGPWASSTLSQPLAPSAPAAPTGLNVLTDDTSLQVAWTAPVDNGGRAIDWYALQHSADDSTWVDDDTTAALAATIRGLSNGTPYRVRVRAHNAIGDGAWVTAPTAVTPQILTPPGAPQSLGLAAGNTSVTATWSSPATTGGRPLLWYAVQHSTDDSTWTNDDTTAGSTFSLTGLPNGTTYYVRIAAVNAIGRGPWASDHATTTTPAPPAPPPPPPPAPPLPPAPLPATKPGAPRIATATAANAQIALTWSAPDDTGRAAITGYYVQLHSARGDDTVAVSGTSTTLVGLANGTPYSLRIAAVNSAGTGAWSPAVDDVVPRTTPDAPAGLRAAAGDGSVALVWSPPTFDGGNAVIGYVVELSTRDDTRQYAVDDTAFAAAGLTNGMSYAIRVAAVNDAGTGAWSAATSVTPTQPRVTVPTTVSASRKGKTVRVRWQAPVQGTPLRYLISASINGRAWQPLGDTAERTFSFTLPRANAGALIKVAAVDSRGRGPWSAAVIT